MRAVPSRDMLGREHAYYRLGPEAYHLKVKEIMDHIDSLPAEWRAFVHEFGWKTTRLARAERLSPTEARKRILLSRLSKIVNL